MTKANNIRKRAQICMRSLETTTTTQKHHRVYMRMTYSHHFTCTRNGHPSYLSRGDGVRRPSSVVRRPSSVAVVVAITPQHQQQQKRQQQHTCTSGALTEHKTVPAHAHACTHINPGSSYFNQRCDVMLQCEFSVR